eukprot:gb/GECH01006597.1/.p1 GENE.gb/GECH01006597.1/~~gb/GECH01006597.1/.p1  ORF type:complete len:162 (+),score=21.74 gb/GECH01006597.1/:1-486(+)
MSPHHNNKNRGNSSASFQHRDDRIHATGTLDIPMEVWFLIFRFSATDGMALDVLSRVCYAWRYYIRVHGYWRRFLMMEMGIPFVPTKKRRVENQVHLPKPPLFGSWRASYYYFKNSSHSVQNSLSLVSNNEDDENNDYHPSHYILKYPFDLERKLIVGLIN